MSLNKLQDYIEMSHKLKDMSGLIPDMSNELIEDIDSLIEKTEQEKFNVVVMGEFSAGKSTFLNAMLGRELLYSSLDEATGSITYIESSENKEVTISTDGEQDTFNIDDDSYEKIKQKVDIENSNSSRTELLVRYPIEGFSNDIVFADTPGLGGLDKTQMLTTKKCIEKANAVIMLVTTKGLSETTRNILEGKHEGFGKIATSNIIIVINKACEEFDDLSHDKIKMEEKFNKFENEVKNQIQNINIKELAQIPVYVIDSRDYLYAVNNETYEKALKNKKSYEIVLSKEQYLERCGFVKFREVLKNYLETDKRAEYLKKDLRDTIKFISEELIKEIEKRQNKNLNNFSLLRQKYTLYKKEACINKTKLYNETMASGRKYLNSFQEDIGADLNQLGKELDKVIFKYIDSNFNALNKFEDGNYNRLRDTAENGLENINNLISNRTSEFYKELTERIEIIVRQNINNIFDSSLNNDFKYNWDIFNNEIKNIKIKEFNMDNKTEEFDKSIYDVQAEINQLNKDIQISKGKIKKSSYVKDKAELEELKKEKIKDLGKREPEVKIKTKYKKKKVFLFFTKEEPYTETELDYSKVKEYDEKYDQIPNWYVVEYRKIEKTENDLNKILSDIKLKEKELTNKNEEYDNLINCREKFSEALKKSQKDEIEFMIEEKKSELFKLISINIKNGSNTLLGRFSNQCEKMICCIKENIQENMSTWISEYEAELDRNLKSLEDSKEDNYSIYLDELNKMQ